MFGISKFRKKSNFKETDVNIRKYYMSVTSGTGLGVRRSKSHLLALVPVGKNAKLYYKIHFDPVL